MTKKILVVDDESSIREALSKVLRGENYDVISASNGQEATEKFGAEQLDLLLLDIGMPLKNGWDTLKWLTEVNPLLPVIIITGRHAQRELAERAGADALMDKPINVSSLLQTIRELIHESKERRAERAIERSPGFLYVSCSHDLFLKNLNERYTAPYPCPELKKT